MRIERQYAQPWERRTRMCRLRLSGQTPPQSKQWHVAGITAHCSPVSMHVNNVAACWSAFHHCRGRRRVCVGLERGGATGTWQHQAGHSVFIRECSHSYESHQVYTPKQLKLKPKIKLLALGNYHTAVVNGQHCNICVCATGFQHTRRERRAVHIWRG